MSNEGTITCPECGTENPARRINGICFNCGHPFSSEAVAIAEENKKRKQAQQAEQKRQREQEAARQMNYQPYAAQQMRTEEQPTAQPTIVYKERPEKKLIVDGFMIFVCLFFPVAGFLLYAIHALESPEEAKMCAIISLVGQIVLILIAYLVLKSTFTAATYRYY